LPQSAINNLRFSRFLTALNLPNQNATQFGNYYLEQLSEKSVFMEGGADLLEKHAQPYKLGIITNGLKQVQRPKLVKSGLADYFEVIVVSDEIGISKPQPAIFEHAFEKMNFPAKDRVLMIGDSLNSDILGGINYGIDTCWYNFKQKENTTSFKPTYVINHLKELKTLAII
ncbi:MAG: YjjG family noncanonical pyrimidine nucleotidase, partial [Saprospiraceae bacterium]